MPAATTMAANKAANNTPSAAPAMMVPFTRASVLHIEPFVDQSNQITANTQQLGPFDIPAYGYLVNLTILAQATGGVNAGTTTAQEDAPFNAYSEIQLADVNGAPIVGPISGYDIYLATKYGSYDFSCDPRQDFSFSNVAGGAAGSGNFVVTYKVPVEICHRDALGAISNQNASSTYKLKMTLNSSAGIYSAAPTTLPTVRTRVFLVAWSQPGSENMRNQPQATQPPSHGTSQYWTKTTFSIPSGSSTVRFPRVGNDLRNVVLVNRRSASTRLNGEADFPDPLQLFFDTRLITSFTKTIWRDEIKRCTGYAATIETPGGQDNGVYVWPWFTNDFDGKMGRELRDGWLPTLQSTRVEVQGTWANACVLDILTNDVAAQGDV